MMAHHTRHAKLHINFTKLKKMSFGKPAIGKKHIFENLDKRDTSKHVRDTSNHATALRIAPESLQFCYSCFNTVTNNNIDNINTNNVLEWCLKKIYRTDTNRNEFRRNISDCLVLNNKRHLVSYLLSMLRNFMILSGFLYSNVM